jgi:hypothetical protein
VLSLLGGISLLLELWLVRCGALLLLCTVLMKFNVSCNSYVPSLSIISKVVVFMNEMERFFVASAVSISATSIDRYLFVYTQPKILKQKYINAMVLLIYIVCRARYRFGSGEKKELANSSTRHKRIIYTTEKTETGFRSHPPYSAKLRKRQT